MTIFLTGGTGFVGSHILNVAHAAGYEVIAVRRPGSQPRIALSQEPTWVEGELAGSFGASLSRCHALIHLAAAGVSPQTGSWKDLIKCNVADGLELLEAASRHGIKRMVLCGSCFEYGQSGERFPFIPSNAPLEPIGPYAASKAAATLGATAMAREHKLELAVLRPFHVFGEGQHEKNFWPSLRRAALAGEDFPMTPGEQIRDFVPVELVASKFVEALTPPDLKPGEPLIENIGTGKPQTLREFAEYWWAHWGAKGKLLIGAVPYRENEVMRYVPEIPVNH